jgi:hypothetical protein
LSAATPHAKNTATQAWEQAMKSAARRTGIWSWWYLLFVVQLIVLWVPLFNRTSPALFGLPFFYWFQLLCVLFAALFNAVIYLATRER